MIDQLGIISFREAFELIICIVVLAAVLLKNIATTTSKESACKPVASKRLEPQEPQYYPKELSQIRQEEYPYLTNEDGTKQIYLDHAGTTLYSKSLLIKTNDKMLKNVFGNPHSQSIPSMKSTSIVEQTRLEVLKLFKADPEIYDIAFTANATGAVKLLAQTFNDCFEDFYYLYNLHSHTSLIGVREMIKTFDSFDSIEEGKLKLGNFQSLKDNKAIPSLVSWTAQSNFNGERLPINDWNKEFKSFGSSEIFTLLDASSMSTTSPPDLSQHISAPDFICVSFYKMFGCPDMGGLIFKKDIAQSIFPYKKYFGGGTVSALSSNETYVERKAHLTTIMEDGTLPIHSIIQLATAIEVFHSIYGGFANVSHHVRYIRQYALTSFSLLKHMATEKPMVIIYSKDDVEHGPIIAMGLLDRDGNPVGYYDFERYASMKNIALRTGTVCNIGGVSKWLNIETKEIKENFQKGHTCGDEMDLINGKPTGIIRISFGAMTTIEEIDYLINTIDEYMSEGSKHFDDNALTPTLSFTDTADDLHVRSLTIYPIKSCKGFTIPQGFKWKVTKYGLEYDRQFSLINLTNNSPLSLKKYRKMTSIVPQLDVTKQVLHVHNKDNESVTIQLNDKMSYDYRDVVTENGDKIYSCIYDENIKTFFTNSIGVPCTLGRLTANKVNTDGNEVAKNSMQNKSAFLLISEASLDYLHDETQGILSDTGSSASGLTHFTENSNVSAELENRFRGNIIISRNEYLQPYDEDKWAKLRIGDNLMLQTIDKCDRCQMITIDGETGKSDPSIYIKLAKERKSNGKVYFGSNLNVDESCLDNFDSQDHFVSVGDKVTIEQYF